MAEFSKLIITNDGQALIAKILAGEDRSELPRFTKICSSSAEYTLDQLDGLSALDGIEQTSLISFIARTNDTAIEVKAIFENEGLTAGYQMRALGLYANDPDRGEILYAVTIETSGRCYMPAYNGVTRTSATIRLITTVGNAENVSIRADPQAYALAGDLIALREKMLLEAETIAALQDKIKALERLVGKGSGKVRFGPADTKLEEKDTLFVVDDWPAEQPPFEAAAFSNVVFRAEAPRGDTRYWGELADEGAAASGGAGGAGDTESVSITSGRLAVSEEEPDDAAFYAKIN